MEQLLWAATVLALGVTAFELARLERDVHLPRPAIAPLVDDARSNGEVAPPDSLAATISRITDRDLFRLERQPAVVGYGTTSTSGAASAGPAGQPPEPPRPQFTVSGIVGGPPWAALLSGVPGRDGGVLVHSGDTLAGFTVRAVRRTGVTITGADTTWHLTLKAPWR
ncbi:MAG TPA: hypothetical protein VF722_10550 [Gemmatimonadaceae bacterium]|jgi:hypothetical protein